MTYPEQHDSVAMTYAELLAERAEARKEGMLKAYDLAFAVCLRLEQEYSDKYQELGEDCNDLTQGKSLGSGQCAIAIEKLREECCK